MWDLTQPYLGTSFTLESEHDVTIHHLQWLISYYLYFAGSVFEPYVPPEGDGVASVISTEVSLIFCNK